MSAKTVWRRQFDEVAEKLRPWVRMGNDGFKWIADNAPEDLYQLHHKLGAIGYAKGWLR